ncbi:heavy-metal-associated domain-containing protein [Podospora appendiculata]|uniref:Heavy-metal-associated domain-containing protein n=1 Tax=Podospora appendiculata TaxID=314037 RepID=A0AAE1C9F9_9PEZI|nr:heavy-metal-associated domain-containing protein [Podospora appendiculata]
MSDVVDATPAPVDAELQPWEHTYKFNVAMSCGGCSGAVDRVLKKLDGVKSYEVSLENQTATVVAEPSLAYEKVLKTIAKTGKKVNTGEADGVAQSVDISA